MRLDILGQIKNRTTFINDPKRLEWLEMQLELMRSLGRREEIEQMEKADECTAQQSELLAVLPDAFVMYAAKETDKRGFTEKHVLSILLIFFEHSTS